MGEGNVEIDKDGFRLIMRLIALVQEGYPAERDSLKKYGFSLSADLCIANKPIHFAELEGVEPFVPLNRSLNKEAMRIFTSLSDSDILPVLLRDSVDMQGKQAISYLMSQGMEKNTLKDVRV